MVINSENLPITLLCFTILYVLKVFVWWKYPKMVCYRDSLSNSTIGDSMTEISRSESSYTMEIGKC